MSTDQLENTIISDSINNNGYISIVMSCNKNRNAQVPIDDIQMYISKSTNMPMLGLRLG